MSIATMYRKCVRAYLRISRVALMVCLPLAVIVNLVLIRAMYLDKRSDFSNTTLEIDTNLLRLQLEVNVHNQTNKANTSETKCDYYHPSHPAKISEEFRKTHYMMVNMNGRLGNQLFKFASLLGIAEQHGYTPFLAKKSLLLSAFENQRYFYHVSMNHEFIFGESRAGKYDCKINGLSHFKNITLDGYYQSWKYFDHIRPRIRKEFQFQKDIIKRAKLEILKYIPGNRTLIGVHVRRGDMNTQGARRRGYNVADVTYLQRALQYFRFTHSNALFIVVSDAISWAKGNLAGNDVVFSQSGVANVDMAILAQCKHSIITSGSFGWWGAYLAGGTTVYFKNYPQPDSWLSKQYNSEDYYPPDWIAM